MISLRLIITNLIVVIASASYCVGDVGTFEHKSEQSNPLVSTSVHEVASLGGATTGSLLEGVVGAVQKGCRHRFYCHSTLSDEAFVGLKTDVNKIVAIKDQPGVFPAPLAGPSSLTFTFKHEFGKSKLTPVIVRPDGTIFQGLPMNSFDSPQKIVISAPAQTGIYTLFVLSNEKDDINGEMMIQTTISNQPQKERSLRLRPFNPKSEHVEQTSAEFFYSVS